QRAETLLSKFGGWYVLGFRFLYGLRTISPLFLGTIGYPKRRFIVLNALGAALWATTFTLAGFGVGATLRAAFGRSSRVEELILASAVAGFVWWLVARRVRIESTSSAHLDDVPPRPDH